MNRKIDLKQGLGSIFLIVFNIVFFLTAGGKRLASVWIAYGFIHAAYAMLLLAPELSRKCNGSSVFGYSVITFSTYYFIIEFVVGVIIILAKPEAYKASFIIQFIIAGIYAALLLSVFLAGERQSTESVEEREAEIKFIKTQASRLHALIDQLPDRQIKKELEKTYDLLDSSPIKTDASVRSIEQQIKEGIGLLEKAVHGFEKDEILRLTNRIQSLINERNRILSTL